MNARQVIQTIVEQHQVEIAFALAVLFHDFLEQMHDSRVVQQVLVSSFFFVNNAMPEVAKQQRISHNELIRRHVRQRVRLAHLVTASERQRLAGSLLGCLKVLVHQLAHSFANQSLVAFTNQAIAKDARELVAPNAYQLAWIRKVHGLNETNASVGL